VTDESAARTSSLVVLDNYAPLESEIQMANKRLNEKTKQEIFQKLVTTQDMGIMSVPESRAAVCKEFDVTDEVLRQIEEEGLEAEWPPLNEAVQEVQ
jgi:hypothetical protein